MKPIKPVAGLPPRQTGNTSADGQLLRLWLQRALQIHDENAQEIAKRLKELDDAISSGGGGSGEPGKDGITPHIGANGNWWIGDTDTGQPSRGEPGYTPVKGTDYFDGDDGLTPYIGANGNWWIGDTDTGEPSQGAPGYTPQRGVDYWTAADKSSIVTEVKKSYFIPTYEKPTVFGCSNSDDLTTIVTNMPNHSDCTFWINATQFPAVYNEILAICKENGLNEAYGNVYLKKRSNVVGVTWEHYRTLFTLINNWTSVNNRGWFEWRVLIAP